jgi:hypothetical protein
LGTLSCTSRLLCLAPIEESGEDSLTLLVSMISKASSQNTSSHDPRHGLLERLSNCLQYTAMSDESKNLRDIADALLKTSERLREEAKVLKERAKVLDDAIGKRARLRELSEAATRAGDRNRKGKRSSYDQGT